MKLVESLRRTLATIRHSSRSCGVTTWIDRISVALPDPRIVGIRDVCSTRPRQVVKWSRSVDAAAFSWP